MKNFKCFTLVEPTQEMLEKFNNDNLVLFLQSEDGIDWYECQSQFSDDTVKIQYDDTGIIRAVVDAPVPQRDNTYAASMLWPLGQSVAEIAISDYPAGVTLDGTWKFDGAKVYRDADIVTEKTQAENAWLYEKYSQAAIQAIVSIQCSAAVGNPRDGDTENLLALQQYVDRLRNPDFSTAPEKPPITV